MSVHNSQHSAAHRLIDEVPGIEGMNYEEKYVERERLREELRARASPMELFHEMLEDNTFQVVEVKNHQMRVRQ